MKIIETLTNIIAREKANGEWQIVTLGMDGKPRTLAARYETSIDARLDANYFATVHRPVPFYVRPAVQL